MVVRSIRVTSVVRNSILPRTILTDRLVAHNNNNNQQAANKGKGRTGGREKFSARVRPCALLMVMKFKNMKKVGMKEVTLMKNLQQGKQTLGDCSSVLLSF